MSSPPSAPPAIAFALMLGAIGCGSVPDDPGARLLAPKGVIRGAVSYQGPRPCSSQGHIVGAAVLLVFDARNPPPPDGLATTAVNFATVTGDVLFASEPRYGGESVYCPAQSGFTESISASAPFVISPMDGGSFQIRAFYDNTGDFLPEFSIRNLPEEGDVAGGDFDTTDALLPLHVDNPNYGPRFLPIDVGVPQASASGTTTFVVPSSGFLADDVAVTLAAPLASARPYFYAQGEEITFDPASTNLTAAVVQSSDQPASTMDGIAGTTESDPASMPVLTIPQDIQVLAPPATTSQATINYYESSFPHLLLPWGLPAGELPTAGAPPLSLPVVPFGGAGAGLLVWQDAALDPTGQSYLPQLIPEGQVPSLWPTITLSRLPDPNVTAPQPIVLMQGITLLGTPAQATPPAVDSLYATGLAGLLGGLFTTGGANGPRPTVAIQDHVTVVLRPSVLCLPPPPSQDPNAPPGIGKLVLAHQTGTAADLDCSSGSCVPDGMPGQPIAPAGVTGQPPLSSLVASEPLEACLPTGLYAIHAVYRDGQAWTVPNEAGVCSPSERAAGGGCSRPVLPSQGSRAVVEVVAATDPTYCASHPVPDECQPAQ